MSDHQKHQNALTAEELGIDPALAAAYERALCGDDIKWDALDRLLEKNPALAYLTFPERLTFETVLHKIARALPNELETALALGRKLLERGVSPDIVLNRGPGYTPLIECMSGIFGEVEALRLFLEFGADPNWRDLLGQTALHEVGCDSRGTYLEKVALLLEHGADPRIADKDGNTPLHFIRREIAEKNWALEVELGHIHRRIPADDAGLSNEELASMKKFERGAEVDKLTRAAEMLTAGGADPEARNKAGQTPEEFGLDRWPRVTNDEGLTLSESTPEQWAQFQEAKMSWTNTVSLWFTTCLSEFGWWLRGCCGPWGLMTGLPGYFYRRALPGESKLAAALRQLPKRGLLPPVSDEELAELSASLEGGLPEAMRAIYKHHGGMKPGANNLELRLKTPDEMVAEIKDRRENPFFVDFPMPSDGREFALFWTDDGEIHAGLFLKAPLAGRVFMFTTPEIFPLPAFRDVSVFYRWLGEGGTSDAGIGQYPSTAPEGEDVVDQELSREMFDRWEADGRSDTGLAVMSLYLSGYDDSGRWAATLESIIDSADTDLSVGLQQEVCYVLGCRRYEPAVEALFQTALRCGVKGSAICALRRIGTESSRQAIRNLKMALRTPEDVYVLRASLGSDY